MPSYFSYIFHPHTVVLHQSIACLYHASMSSEEWFYSFVLWVQLDMAKSKKSKENNIVGSAVTRRVKRKRFCRRDSAGTYSAVEGPSPPAKSTNTVSPAPPAAASASTEPSSQRVLVCLLRNWPVPKLPSHLTLLPKHCWHNRTWQDQMNLMSINTKTVPDRVKLQLHAPLYVLSQFDVH